MATELNELLLLWQSDLGINAKRASNLIGVREQHYGRLQRGSYKLSIESLQRMASESNTSLYNMLIAYMLLDENIGQLDQSSDHFGDRLALCIHERLSRYGRINEKNSASRQVLWCPAALESLIEEMTANSARGNGQDASPTLPT